MALHEFSPPPSSPLRFWPIYLPSCSGAQRKSRCGPLDLRAPGHRPQLSPPSLTERRRCLAPLRSTPPHPHSQHLNNPLLVCQVRVRLRGLPSLAWKRQGCWCCIIMHTPTGGAWEIVIILIQYVSFLYTWTKWSRIIQVRLQNITK